jgi:hypothetical protein
MGNDGLAVAERIAVIDDVGKLPTRRRRCVENVFMHERQANESHESKDLQPVAVVVGYAEKSRVRVKRDHERKILRQRRASEELRFPRGNPVSGGYRRNCNRDSSDNLWPIRPDFTPAPCLRRMAKRCYSIPTPHGHQKISGPLHRHRELPPGLSNPGRPRLDLRNAYRLEAVKAKGRVTVYSRRHTVLNRKFGYIAEALEGLPDETVVDGKLVAMDEEGRSNFNLLQNFKSAESKIHNFRFDVLALFLISRSSASHRLQSTPS